MGPRTLFFSREIPGTRDSRGLSRLSRPPPSPLPKQLTEGALGAPGLTSSWTSPTPVPLCETADVPRVQPLREGDVSRCQTRPRRLLLDHGATSPWRAQSTSSVTALSAPRPSTQGQGVLWMAVEAEAGCAAVAGVLPRSGYCHGTCPCPIFGTGAQSRPADAWCPGSKHPRLHGPVRWPAPGCARQA